MPDSYVYTGEEGKNELRILETLIADKDMTPEQAVKQIVDLTQAPQAHSRQIGDHCYYTARSLMSTAASTAPDEQQKLVAFFHELRNKTITDPSTGKVREHDGRAIWTGLPTFGYTFADDLNSIPGM